MDFANVLDLEKEKNELIDGACQMIDDYVETNIDHWQKPD